MNSKTHKEMAEIVLNDEKQGGVKSFMLYMEMSVRTGLSPDYVKKRIQAYADEL